MVGAFCMDSDSECAQAGRACNSVRKPFKRSWRTAGAGVTCSHHRRPGLIGFEHGIILRRVAIQRPGPGTADAPLPSIYDEPSFVLLLVTLVE